MTEEATAYAARRQAVLDEVRRVLVDAARLPREPSEIDPDTALFGTGLGLDSIDGLELVVTVEHRFGVTLADESVGTVVALRTVNTVVDWILAKQEGR